MWHYVTSRERDCRYAAQLRSRILNKRWASVELSKRKEVASPHKGGINSLSLETVEHRYLLAGATDGCVSAFDLRQGREEGGLERLFLLGRGLRAAEDGPAGAGPSLPVGHHYSVSSVQWYPVDTGMFITASFDHTVNVWDANALQVACKFDLAGRVYGAAMSSVATSHCLIAAVTEHSQVRLCDLASEGVTHTLSGHRAAVWAVEWSLSSDYELYTGGCDGAIRMWDIRRAGAVMVLDQHNAHSARLDMVEAATAHAHGGSQAPSALPPRYSGIGMRNSGMPGVKTSRDRGPVANLSRQGAKPTRSLGKRGREERGGAAGEGSGVGARTGFGSEVRVTAHEGELTALKALPGGTHLLSAARDGRVRLWDLSTGRNTLVNYAATHNTSQKGNQLSVSADGEVLYYPSGSNIKLYNVHSGAHLKTLQGHYLGVNCCVANHVNQEVYSGGNDRQILVWEPSIYNESEAEEDLGHRIGSASDSNTGIDGQVGTEDVDAWSDDD